MKIDCPYCALASKTGELFCSCKDREMKGLKSGVFSITTAAFPECDWHTTRLSLNFNLDGKQTYETAGHAFQISQDRFLVLNEGQKFKTRAEGTVPNRMITIAFEVGLCEKIAQGLKVSDAVGDADPTTGKFDFIERTYALDSLLHNQVVFLHDNHEIISSDVLEERLEEILVRIVSDQLQIKSAATRINNVKRSTRMEIQKRLHAAVAYLEENYAEDITVTKLARVACMSEFHFKRLFKDLFLLAPYQYLKQFRLQKAKSFLLNGYPVHDACTAVGWSDCSSFIRLFRNETRLTPVQFKRLHLVC